MRASTTYIRAPTTLTFAPTAVGIAPHVSGPDHRTADRRQSVRQAGRLAVRRRSAALSIGARRRDRQAPIDRAEYQGARGCDPDRAIPIRSGSKPTLPTTSSISIAFEPLLAKHFVTANDVFNARSRVSAAEAGVQAAHSDVSKAQNQLGQYGDINALRKAAEAAVYDAKLNVGYCYVRAPYNGWVTNLNIAEGQYANEGREVVSLIDDRKWYVIANFRETFLSHIQPGMAAEVFILAYPNKRFRGRVQGVGWALYQQNGATVEGLPQTEPTLNWVRLSQRFPVRIVARGPRPEVPVQNGHHSGRDDPGLPGSR